MSFTVLMPLFGSLADAAARLSPTYGPWLATLALSLLYPVLVTVACMVPAGMALSLLTPLGWLPRLLLALPLAILLALAVFKAAGLMVPTTPAAREPGTLRIAHLNALLHTPETSSKLAFVTGSDADIVSLVEVNSQLAAQLPSLTAYPYQADSTSLYHPRHPEHRIYPTVLLSRWPVERVAHWTDRLNLYRIRAPRGDVYVLQMHPYAPVSTAMQHGRNHLLQAILRQKGGQKLPSPLIIIGDYNTTPWDPALLPLTMNGLIFQGPRLPTFHRALPVIPIDLIFTQGLQAPKIQRIQVPTTDHLGLIADFPIQ